MASAPDKETTSLLLAAGDPGAIAAARRAVALCDGALIPVVAADRDRRYAIERLLVERTLSVNTAAAGGNASLMTLAP